MFVPRLAFQKLQLIWSACLRISCRGALPCSVQGHSAWRCSRLDFAAFSLSTPTISNTPGSLTGLRCGRAVRCQSREVPSCARDERHGFWFPAKRVSNSSAKSLKVFQLQETLHDGAHMLPVCSHSCRSSYDGSKVGCVSITQHIVLQMCRGYVRSKQVNKRGVTIEAGPRAVPAGPVPT